MAQTGTPQRVMTEEELAALERLRLDARPIPWGVQYGGAHGDTWVEGIRDAEGDRVVKTDSGCYPPEAPTAEYIVAACNVLPALVAEVRRLRAECARARQILDDLTGDLNRQRDLAGRANVAQAEAKAENARLRAFIERRCTSANASPPAIPQCLGCGVVSRGDYPHAADCELVALLGREPRAWTPPAVLPFIGRAPRGPYEGCQCDHRAMEHPGCCACKAWEAASP